MIARLAREHLIGTLTEHDFEIPEREKFPARHGKVPIEAQFFDVVVRFRAKVFYGEHVPSMDYFSARFHIRHDGLVISCGTTYLSKSSAVTCPRFTAASFSVVLWWWAF